MQRSIIISIALSLFTFTSPVFAVDDSVVEKEWQEYMDSISKLGPELVQYLDDPDDPLLRQELYRYIFSTMSSTFLYLFLSDIEHPEFVPFIHQANSALGANPDDVYYLAHLEPDGVYKISGFRGTTRIVDFQIGTDTMFPRGGGGPGKTLANYFLDDLSLGPNGEFEVILSKERPAGYEGDWWELSPEVTHVIVRQISYDWVNEVDARIAIDRLDTPASKRRMTADEIRKELKQRAVLAESWVKFSREPMIVKSMQEKGLVNKVKGVFYDEGGRTGQLYVIGIFDLKDDEAMIYETDVPDECLYWNIQLTDMLWSSIDWNHRHSSLNGHTARLDDDGKFRGVISKTDPGVPNWLDTYEYNKGTIFNRWSVCSSFPEPMVKVVKLADLRKHLPENTPVVTQAERDAAIRLRSKGVQLRRRW